MKYEINFIALQCTFISSLHLSVRLKQEQCQTVKSNQFHRTLRLHMVGLAFTGTLQIGKFTFTHQAFIVYPYCQRNNASLCL